MLKVRCDRKAQLGTWAHIKLLERVLSLRQVKIVLTPHMSGQQRTLLPLRYVCTF